MLANNLKVVESDKSKLLLNNKKKKTQKKNHCYSSNLFYYYSKFWQPWLMELIFPKKLHKKMSLCLQNYKIQ